MKKPTVQGEKYDRFFLKQSSWLAICALKGWDPRPGSGATAKLAAKLFITRQYARGVVARRFGCSSTIMGKLVDFLGIPEGDCWCHLFERRTYIGMDKNHPIFNIQKYNGEAPYAEYSESANLRQQDYEVERVKEEENNE